MRGICRGFRPCPRSGPVRPRLVRREVLLWFRPRARLLCIGFIDLRETAIGLSLGVLTAGHQAVVVGAVPFPVARATILVIELPIG